MNIKQESPCINETSNIVLSSPKTLMVVPCTSASLHSHARKGASCAYKSHVKGTQNRTKDSLTGQKYTFFSTTIQ